MDPLVMIGLWGVTLIALPPWFAQPASRQSVTWTMITTSRSLAIIDISVGASCRSVG